MPSTSALALTLAPSLPPAPFQPVVLDAEMRRIYRIIEQLGPANIPLLILGETGCGKEIIADCVHRCSALAQRPLVRINCAGLTESMVESELFGHERGAFTGAIQAHRGVFEVADGGTLFLDEVAELPLRTQAKLLRVLELGEFTRLGSSQVRKVGVRVLAATHSNLLQQIEQGGFRRDLYFRLNGATLEVPPLRERRSEIIPLATLFLNRHAASLNRAALRLDAAAATALCSYAWPGNVRELRNVIECAAAMSAGAEIGVEQLALGRPLHALERPAPAAPAALPASELVEPDMRRAQHAFERAQIEAALTRACGNQTRAARLLGISRRTLSNKLNAHGFERPRKPTTRPCPGPLLVSLRSLDARSGQSAPTSQE